MKALRFEIKAKQGMLKNPLTSRGVNLTFTNLHVVALKGIIGAILGFDGKLTLNNNQQALLYIESKEQLTKEKLIPENILKLENLSYSIIPNFTSDNFIKRMYTTTNNNGINYSHEKNDIVTIINKNELLEDVHYTVYIYEDSPYYSELKESLFNSSFYYRPFLGKTQFPIELEDVTELELELFNQGSNFQLASLFEKGISNFDVEENLYLDDLSYFCETIPSGINYQTTLYAYKEYLLTNSYLTGYGSDIYKDEGGKLLAKLS